MVLDYIFNEHQAFIYVVQEWKRQKWNQVVTTHDLKEAVEIARGKHFVTKEPTRVLRVEEDVIVKYADPVIYGKLF